MARMHTRKHGKSGSKMVYRDSAPEWVQLNKDEIRDLIIKLKKEGLTKSKIGMILRDQYGIPKVKQITGKRMGDIVADAGLEDQIPEDLISLMRKAVSLNRHLSRNPKDLKNKRNLQLIEAKIKRLSDYYKRIEKLPGNWNYSIETAELIVK